MPQFDFHLDGVLHHRKNTEREKQRLLAMVLEQMTQLEAKLRAWMPRCRRRRRMCESTI